MGVRGTQRGKEKKKKKKKKSYEKKKKVDFFLVEVIPSHG